MRRRDRGRLVRLGAFTAAVALTAILPACQDRDGNRAAQARALVKDGSAKRLLQAYFDRHPQCSLLPIGPDFDYVGGNDKPIVQALIVAGMLTARPLNDALHTVH